MVVAEVVWSCISVNHCVFNVFTFWTAI